MRIEVYNKTLSRDIKVAMLRKNINRRQLSKELNISYPTIRKYIKRPFSMQIRDLDRICEFLDVNLLIKLIN